MRYLHQPLSELKRWTIAELELYVDGAMQLVEAENDSTSRSGDDE